KIAKEDPLHEENQDDAEGKVVQNGIGRDLDQVAAVVNALDAHAGRKNIQAVDALDLGLDTADGRQALLAAPHQHAALHDIVILVLARDAKSRLVADGNVGDIAHPDGVAVGRSQHGVADIVGRANKPYAPHHGGLRPDIHGVAADVDVAVVQDLQ